MDPEELRQQVTRLLWAGKPAEAKTMLSRQIRAVESELAAVEREMLTLKETLQALQEIAPPGTKGHLHVPPTSPGTSVEGVSVDKVFRNEKIVELALELSRTHGGKVYIRGLANEIKARGIEMGVSEGRVNTALSNVLSKTGGFTKLAKGVYRVPETKRPGGDTPGLFSSTASSEAH